MTVSKKVLSAYICFLNYTSKTTKRNAFPNKANARIKKCNP